MAPLSYPATHLSHLFQPGSVQQLLFLSWVANKHFVPAASKSNPSIRLWTFLGNCSRWGSALWQGGPSRVVAHYRWLPQVPTKRPKGGDERAYLGYFPRQPFFLLVRPPRSICSSPIHQLTQNPLLHSKWAKIFFTTNILAHIDW